MPNPITPLVDSNERRITRLEDGVDVIAEKVAKVEVKLDRIEDSLDSILDKTQKIYTKSENVDDRLRDLESHKEKQIAKTKWAAKAVTGLIIAASVSVIEFAINHYLTIRTLFLK